MAYQQLNQTEVSIEDDFCYKNNVHNAPIEARLQFLKKVYAILSAQVLMTTLVCGAVMSSPTLTATVKNNADFMPMLGIMSFMVLIWLHVQRRNYPTNFYLLGIFTLLQSLTIATVTTFYDSVIVIKAAVITGTVFMSLTMYTFNSKKDYSSWGAALFCGLWILIVTNLVHVLFFPESPIYEELSAAGGAGLFCLFIIYDTHLVMKKLSPEEYILAAINLYLDILNLFLEILRIMGQNKR
jgi:FtsH-binding integral membrane protein